MPHGCGLDAATFECEVSQTMTKNTSFTWQIEAATQARSGALAELVAVFARRGDVIALEGDLGAGKTTWARAFIRAMIADAEAEVPSPTFPLQQVYDGARSSVSHFDLYRLDSADGLIELGFDDALQTGISLIEWPDRAAGHLPADLLTIVIAETRLTDTRNISLIGCGHWAERLERLADISGFLGRAGWSDAHIAYLQGDASARRYARLRRGEGTAILMDAPRQPDGPAVRDGMPYSRIAHLAEDVRPFIAIDQALRRAGLSAPEIFAYDEQRGLLLLEDLGDGVYGAELAAGRDQGTLWRAAVDVLIELRRVPRDARQPDGSVYMLPRFDRAALEIEVDLLLDWYWPEIKGRAAEPAERTEFRLLWSPVIDRLMSLPPGWFLRDVHSPNLLWLPQRSGVARVGIIDFQDALAEHFAFDLASLLQDARVDVPAALEVQLLNYYCATVARNEPGFDQSTFRAAYAAFGAQRNTRLIGLWVRLLRRDGKPGYLQHMNRTWRYLERNLAAAELTSLRAWYDRNFTIEERTRRIEP